MPKIAPSQHSDDAQLDSSAEAEGSVGTQGAQGLTKEAARQVSQTTSILMG